jgi:hydrogenase maturation protease
MGTRPEILVLCLGNDILADDGVGWAVADALEISGLPEGVLLKKSALAGLYLLDILEGYQDVVVVDAVRTGLRLPGTVLSFPLEDLRSPTGPSPHSVGLPTVLEVARRSGVEVPGRIHLVMVEVEDMETLSEGLTDEVRRAVPAVVSAVLDAVARLRGTPP